MGLEGLGQEVSLQELGGDFECLFRIGLARAAERLVKLPGEERLGGFGLLGDGAHILEKVGECGLLLRESAKGFFAWAFVGEGPASRIVVLL